MKRRTLIATVASASLSQIAKAGDLANLLTVSGRIHRSNDQVGAAFRFTRKALLELPQITITTATAWTPVSAFTGPALIAVMGAVGVQAGTLRFKTLDGYSAAVPWTDLERYGVILAHTQNGKWLSKKRWGPLWTIYPRDQFPDQLSGPVATSRFIWQVSEIRVEL